MAVADVNDNSPLFKEGQKQTVYFNENEPAGARYSTVIAGQYENSPNLSDSQ